MSDPIAVSILAKLTSWYPFDSDFTDAHGPNDMAAVISPGFAAGKVGNYLLAGAQAKATLAAPVAFTPTTGSMFVGGWFKYTSAVPSVASFGLTGAPATGSNEAHYIFSQTTGGGFGAFGWVSGGGSTYSVLDSQARALSYPVTFSADDSNGQSATSDQVIRIVGTGVLLPGWYFVVANWENGVRTLYVDADLRATAATPPASVDNAPATTIQVANQYGGTVSEAGLDECFFGGAAVLTQEEVTWLYNAGAGRSYAAVVAAAA